ncbi:hypothetical protein ACWEWG_07070 [Streptomyces sp. NPDC003758]
MSLLPWRVSSPNGAAPNGGKKSGSSEFFPGVPVGVSSDGSPSAHGHWPWRTTYAERHDVPDTNAVTRQLAGVMHERVHRIGQARDLIGRWQDRTLGRPQRAVRQMSPIAGETLAKWALDNVLNTRKRPTPSFGFGLAPVLTHSVAANRQRKIRGLLVAGVVGLITVRHPWGAGALVAAVVLYQFFIAAGRLRLLLRWGLNSLVPMALLAAGVFLAWTQIRPYAPVLKFAIQDAVSAAVWLALLLSVTYTLDRWVSLAYLASLGPWREQIARRPRFAPRSAARIADCETTELWQSTPYRKEAGADRFVGAGLDAWRSGGPRIQLTPARRARDEDEAEKASDGNELSTKLLLEDESSGGASTKGMRTFEADELLDKVRDELEDLKGVLVETHALPNCDVFETLAVPQSRWKKLTRTPDRPGNRPTPFGTEQGTTEKTRRAPWPEAKEMIAETRKAPSGHPSRRYLAAQVVDWKGHIVVTVFAHAALEGKTLHFVTRPQVLAPLKSEACAESAKGWELVGKYLLAPVHAVGDTVALAHKSYGIIIRTLGTLVFGALAQAMRQQVATALDQPTKDDDTAVSLREHCSHIEPEDMHQTEDAARHISILQSRMFSTVTAFLDDHGVFTGDFRRQAEQVVTQFFISGDHNQVNTGTVHGNQTQTNQTDGAKTKG